MQFSDTTNKNGLIQRYEDYTNFGDGVVTDDPTLLSKVTADINETLHDLTSEIMLSDDNFQFDDPYRTDYAVATTPLVASQRDYQFDSISFLSLTRVDISYDGTNYYRATPFDSGAYGEGLGNDTLTDNDFSKTEPMYDPKAFGFWLYPMADATDVSNGGEIRIEYNRSFAEFATTDTTKEPPIVRTFHELIAIGAAMKYLIRKRDPNAASLKVLYDEGKEAMKKFYGRRNEDFTLTFNPQIQDYS